GLAYLSSQWTPDSRVSSLTLGNLRVYLTRFIILGCPQKKRHGGRLRRRTFGGNLNRILPAFPSCGRRYSSGFFCFPLLCAVLGDSVARPRWPIGYFGLRHELCGGAGVVFLR